MFVFVNPPLRVSHFFLPYDEQSCAALELLFALLHLLFNMPGVPPNALNLFKKFGRSFLRRKKKNKTEESGGAGEASNTTNSTAAAAGAGAVAVANAETSSSSAAAPPAAPAAPAAPAPAGVVSVPHVPEDAATVTEAPKVAPIVLSAPVAAPESADDAPVSPVSAVHDNVASQGVAASEPKDPVKAEQVGEVSPAAHAPEGTKADEQRAPEPRSASQDAQSNLAPTVDNVTSSA